MNENKKYWLAEMRDGSLIKVLAGDYFSARIRLREITKRPLYKLMIIDNDAVWRMAVERRKALRDFDAEFLS